jgi:hypothetical protein
MLQVHYLACAPAGTRFWRLPGVLSSISDAFEFVLHSLQPSILGIKLRLKSFDGRLHLADAFLGVHQLLTLPAE